MRPGGVRTVVGHFGQLAISEYQDLSAPFIRKFQDKLNWWYISCYQTLSESFIREFQDKFEWMALLYDTKQHFLCTHEFLQEFKRKLPVNTIRRTLLLIKLQRREKEKLYHPDTWPADPVMLTSGSRLSISREVGFLFICFSVLLKKKFFFSFFSKLRAFFSFCVTVDFSKLPDEWFSEKMHCLRPC